MKAHNELVSNLKYLPFYISEGGYKVQMPMELLDDAIFALEYYESLLSKFLGASELQAAMLSEYNRRIKPDNFASIYQNTPSSGEPK
jgi:hypothetical protein